MDHAAIQLNRRIRNLGWSKAEVIRHTGISFKTIDRLMSDGVVPTRQDKRRELAIGLGLVPEALDRLSNGETCNDLADPDWDPEVAAGVEDSRFRWNSSDRPHQDIRDEVQAMLDQISSRSDLMEARAAVSAVLKRHHEEFLKRVVERDHALAANAGKTDDQGIAISDTHQTKRDAERQE